MTFNPQCLYTYIGPRIFGEQRVATHHRFFLSFVLRRYTRLSIVFAIPAKINYKPNIIVIFQWHNCFFLTTWIVFHLSLRHWQESSCDNQCEILSCAFMHGSKALLCQWVDEISFLKIHAVYLCVCVRTCMCVSLLQR